MAITNDVNRAIGSLLLRGLLSYLLTYLLNHPSDNLLVYPLIYQVTYLSNSLLAHAFERIERWREPSRIALRNRHRVSLSCTFSEKQETCMCTQIHVVKKRISQ